MSGIPELSRLRGREEVQGSPGKHSEFKSNTSDQAWAPKNSRPLVNLENVSTVLTARWRQVRVQAQERWGVRNRSGAIRWSSGHVLDTQDGWAELGAWKSERKEQTPQGSPLPSTHITHTPTLTCVHAHITYMAYTRNNHDEWEFLRLVLLYFKMM